MRGLKHKVKQACTIADVGRTLTWVRGLKQKEIDARMAQDASHPYMGAWIETTLQMFLSTESSSRTLTWVRGLKHSKLFYVFCIHVAPLHGCVD